MGKGGGKPGSRLLAECLAVQFNLNSVIYSTACFRIGHMYLHSAHETLETSRGYLRVRPCPKIAWYLASTSEASWRLIQKRAKHQRAFSSYRARHGLARVKISEIAHQLLSLLFLFLSFFPSSLFSNRLRFTAITMAAAAASSAQSQAWG